MTDLNSSEHVNIQRPEGTDLLGQKQSYQTDLPNHFQRMADHQLFEVIPIVKDKIAAAQGILNECSQSVGQILQFHHQLKASSKDWEEQKKAFKKDVADLVDQMTQWDKTRRMVRALSARESDQIKIDCEGMMYKTSRRVLTKFKSSKMAKMFQGIDVIQNNDDPVCIEHDITAFKKVIAKIKAYPHPAPVHNQDVIEDMKHIEREFGIDFERGVQMCFDCPEVLRVFKENPEKKVKDIDMTITNIWKSLQPLSIDDIAKSGVKLDFDKNLKYGEIIDEENGFYYFGQKDGEDMSGVGRLIMPNQGFMIDGVFDNMQVVWGRRITHNGDYYIGEFKDNMHEGMGEYHDPNGGIMKGRWEENNLVEEI